MKDLCPYCAGLGENPVFEQVDSDSIAKGVTLKGYEACTHCGGKGLGIKPNIKATEKRMDANKVIADIIAKLERGNACVGSGFGSDKD